MNRNSSRRQQRAIFLALGVLLGMACGLQWVTGQGAAPFYQAPYDKSYLTAAGALDEKLVKQETLVKSQILLGALPYAENADRLKRWYTGYQFRAFSHIDQLHKIPARRKDIVDDLRRAKSKEIHDSLLAITDKYMKTYVTASQNIHPAVRFNAMLVIGDLNADEQGFQNRYERPLPSALDFLLQEYQNPKQSDAVKLAAMIGILRHSQMNWSRTDPNTKIPAAQQQQIAQLMLTLVTTKDAPPGRTPEGHIWMQRRGIDILAALGMVGNIDLINQAVTSLIADHDADMSLRCTAAAALYTTNSKAPAKSKIDPAKESLQLAALLVEACHRQLDKMDAWQKKKQPGMMGGMGGYGMSGYPGMSDGGMMPGMSSGAGMAGMSGLDGGMGLGYGEEGSGMAMGMPTGPKDPLTELFRRQIKYEIDCVKRGMEGLGRGINPDPRKAFPELYKDVEEVWKATDPQPKAGSLNLTSLQKGLKDSLKTLETKTEKLLPKPKEPDPVQPVSDLPADIPAVPPAGDVPAENTGAGAAAPGTPAAGAATPAAPVPGAAVPGAGGAPAAGAPTGGAPAAPAGAAGQPAAGNPAAGNAAKGNPAGDVPPP